MKNLLLLILIMCIVSCSSEPIENQIETENYSEKSIKSIGANMITAENIDLRSGLELASYFTGRALLNNEEARTQIINLSKIHNGVISLDILFDEDIIDTRFKLAFIDEFSKFALRPGDENGIEPLFYRNLWDNSNNLMEEQGFNKINTQNFLIFLTEINCLEFYFPIVLDFKPLDMRMTVTVVRLDSNECFNFGGELYYEFDKRGIKINRGNLVTVNESYVNNLKSNNNNLTILRPNRTVNDVYNYCDYPYDEYPVDDFTNFLN